MISDFVQKLAAKRSLTTQEALELVKATATQPESDSEAPKDSSETNEDTTETVDNSQEESVDTLTKEDTQGDSGKNEDKDHDWKKRYADLKRHVDTDIKKQLEEERKKRIEAEKALEEGATRYVKPEDLAKFEEEYGDLAPIIKELASKEAERAKREFLEMFEARKQAEEAEKAEQAAYLTEAQKLVAEKHPDFKEIATSKTFQVWLSQQLDVVKRLAAESDPQSAIHVLNLYKKDTGYTAKKTAEAKQRKSEVVKVTEEPVKPKSPDFIDVESLKKEIDKAQRTGDHKKLGELLQKANKLTKQG